ncbi:hypothetical protein ES707_19072 [subsurface metagenome]
MLLINNYQTQVRLRSKNSAPGTDDNIKLSVSYPLPLIKLFTQGQLAVKDSYLMGKT